MHSIPSNHLDQRKSNLDGFFFFELLKDDDKVACGPSD